jgi:Copper type II ascorbate-dependent monooxygenase, C-terminal domain
MRIPRLALLIASVIVVATAFTAVKLATAAASPSYPITTVSVSMPHAYKPVAAPRTTDDYHCTLLNPHVTRNSYVISSQFLPGSREDHHALLYLVPPSLAADAERADVGGKGWSCFGAAAVPGLPISQTDQILSIPMLSVWAPGHGADILPKDTGIALPAGSLVIMQVHYNLLVGDKPVKNSLVLHTVPISTPLLPLKLLVMYAPPDIPCPAGVTGPLCSRSASLASLGQRFGQSAVSFVNQVETFCGRNPADPPAGDSTSCAYPLLVGGYIDRVQGHMHLLGHSVQMVLNPGTPTAKTLLNVPDYNFDYQKAYNLATPVLMKPGDRVQISCTYNPALEQELPILRNVPPHFVTWGDGSTDEMCTGLAWYTASLPNPHFPV